MSSAITTQALLPSQSILKVEQEKLVFSSYSQEAELVRTDVKCQNVTSKILAVYIQAITETGTLRAVNFTGYNFEELADAEFSALIALIKAHPAVKTLCFTKRLLSEAQYEQVCILTNSKKGIRLIDSEGNKFGSVYTNYDEYILAKNKAHESASKYQGGMAETTQKALSKFQQTKGRLPKLVFDFGAGTGRDSINLLEAQCPKICALDGDLNSLLELIKHIPKGMSSKVTTVFSPLNSKKDLPENLPEDVKILFSSFIDLEVSEKVELLVASFAWPYRPPEDFPTFWNKTVSIVASGGYICGQFYGPKTSTRQDPAMTYHTKVQVIELLKEDFTDISIETKNETVYGGDGNDDEPWGDLYHVVAKRK